MTFYSNNVPEVGLLLSRKANHFPLTYGEHASAPVPKAFSLGDR